MSEKPFFVIFTCSSLARELDDERLSPNEDFVPVSGVVHHQTSLGIFLEVAQRQVFIPANCISTPSQKFEAGEPATIMVLRRFAQQEGLVAKHP
jgi:hypothetical protein